MNPPQNTQQNSGAVAATNAPIAARKKSVRLPLSVKIIAWFFLNLVLVGTVVVLVFTTQFRLDLEWIFNTSARERVEAMRNLLAGELSNTPTDEWQRVLERFSAAYGVRCGLFDDDGNFLVGLTEKLPAEVLNRIQHGPQPPSSSASSAATNFQNSANPNRAQASPETSRLFSNNDAPRDRDPFRHRRGPPIRAFMHTTNPAHYWLLLSLRIDNVQIGGPMRAILVTESSSLAEGGLIFDLKPWLILGAGAAIFSVLFWLPLVSSITRAIRQMTNATRQIAEGRFDVRVSSRRRDELGSLGDSINQMALRLDGFVTGQKRFLGDIAHELCSPLARLQMALGILEERTTGDQKKYAKSAGEKAAHIAALVNDLLAFSKASFSSMNAATVRLRAVNVLEVAREAVRRESVENAEIEIQIPAELFVSADPELLIRALSNLLRNAIRHARDCGAITIVAEKKQSDKAIIRVADNGTGVPENELPKIFDAFYRVDAARTRETGGVGLGLAIVKTCVESCRGTVTAQNRAPSGLEIFIELPIAAESQTTPQLSLSSAASE